MLADVSKLSLQRLREVRSYLGMIRKLSSKTSPLTFNLESIIAKGLFFVHLYGAYEFTVVSAVQKTIQMMNSSGSMISDCEPVVLSLVLNPECDSLSDVGRSRAWETRRDLFDRIKSPDPLSIEDSLFPTDGRNLKFEQLQSIWLTFRVRDPVLPRMSLKSRIEELVDNRNAIAHGRESPAVVGGRYTPTELGKTYKDVNELCSYLVQTLENYLTKRDYIS